MYPEWRRRGLQGAQRSQIAVEAGPQGIASLCAHTRAVVLLRIPPNSLLPRLGSRLSLISSSPFTPLVAMASDGEDKKVFSLLEVEQHVAQDDCWMVIHGKVYDVTKFMDDHPGGDDVLLQTAGKDASEEFDDVGHSKSAIEQLKDFYVGECPEVLEKKVASVPATDSKVAASDGPTLTHNVGFFSKVLQFLVPLVLLGVAVALRKYGKKDIKN